MKGREEIVRKSVSYGILVALILIVFGVYGEATKKTFAESKTATVTVADACSFSGTVVSDHTASLEMGTTTNDIGSTKLTTICNDANGFAIYAVGFTNDEYGNTNLVNPSYNQPIPTGAEQSGTSTWRMKIAKDTTSYLAENLSIDNGFGSYTSVPNYYTKIASYSANTDVTTGSSVLTTYSVSILGAQVAGSYGGKVKYVMVHPSTESAPLPVEYMQDFNNLTATARANVVEGMETEKIYRLQDSRDGQYYWISKLKDGKVWMVVDLRIGNVTLTQDLTSENTNIATTVSASTFNGWSSSSVGSSYTVGQYIRMGNYSGQNPPAFGTTDTGVLYNFYAASAGTITDSSNSVDAEYDVCPAGWRMPTGGNGTYSEWNNLYAQYNTSAKLRAAPSNGGAGISLGGFAVTGSRGYVGSYGVYWSKSYAQSANMYNLLLTTSSVDAINSIDRTYGASIRCILKTN